MLEVKNGELKLYGNIGGYFEDGISASDFSSALGMSGEGPLTLYINSDGGDVYDGIAIYSQIKRRGDVKVVVDSLAASIASVIAMAADEIVMMPHSELMVHNPWTVAMGDARELSWIVDSLERIGDNIASIYAERSGQSKERMIEIMDGKHGNGTYLSAEDAVELGIADSIHGEAEKPRIAASESRQPIVAACGFSQRIAASHSIRRAKLQ